MGNSIIILLVLLCTFSLAMAQAPQNPPTEAIDKFIDAQMRKQHIPGLSLAIIKDGKLLLTKGYGLADVELNVAATPQTVWQIQSITKTFTASAVMILAREGKISLDDEVGKYLEGVPQSWKGITVRRLLNHTSGVKDYINEPFASLRVDISDEEVFKKTAERPLNFPPGEKYTYSNTGYLILGMIIKKVSGDSYGEFLHKRIFDPLGMSQTRVVSLSEIIPRRASGYSLQDGKLVRGDFVAQSILSYPGGGLLSTVLDMAKYDAIWQEGKIIEESARKEMWTRGVLNDGERTSYGLGWGIADLGGWRQMSHSGGHMTGFGSRYAVYPQRRLSIVVLTNQNNANNDRIVQGVAGLIDEALTPPSMMKEKAETDEKGLQRLVRAVADLAGKNSDEELICAPLRKSATEDAKKMLAAALPTAQAMKYLGSDDVSKREVLADGVMVEELRYYRMKNGEKARYFKFYLTPGRKVAGLLCWDE